MIWSFFWRFVLLAMIFACVLTFAAGFVGRLAGLDVSDMYTVGSVAQGVALLVAAFLALGGAQNDAKKTRTK